MRNWLGAGSFRFKVWRPAHVVQPYVTRLLSSYYRVFFFFRISAGKWVPLGQSEVWPLEQFSNPRESLKCGNILHNRPTSQRTPISFLMCLPADNNAQARRLAPYESCTISLHRAAFCGMNGAWGATRPESGAACTNSFDILEYIT